MIAPRTVALYLLVLATTVPMVSATPERGIGQEPPRDAAVAGLEPSPDLAVVMPGGDTCAAAVSLDSVLVCDDTWLFIDGIGVDTATASSGPAGSCWKGSDGVDDDVWYSFTNPTSNDLIFRVSTDDLANISGDPQLAVYGRCSGAELACSEDRGTVLPQLADTGFFTLPPATTAFIQVDAFAADNDFDRVIFKCDTTPGGSCGNAIALGTLTPDPAVLAAEILGLGQPRGGSDYTQIEPTFGEELNQPESCFTFIPSADAWAQIAASPVSNNARVILSEDGGQSWETSSQCWTEAPDVYDTSPQIGRRVTGGTEYCLCIDSYDVPVVNAGDVWDLELYLWPLGGATNTDCGKSEPLDFCASPTVSLTGLNSTGAGLDPGIPIQSGCSGGFWDICSGFGTDLNYHLLWSQEMVACGCTGFEVTQTAPDLGTRAGVCDASVQVGTGCPPSPSNCVATADDGGPGITEVATVAGLGPADVGTVYFTQVDHYMQSACPDFDVTFELLGCVPGCDVCNCTPIVPTGEVANHLRATGGLDDVALSWPLATVSPPSYSVFRTEDKTELAETPLGIGDELRLAVTTMERFDDIGVLVASSTLLFYEVLPGDGCGGTVYP